VYVISLCLSLFPSPSLSSPSLSLLPLLSLFLPSLLYLSILHPLLTSSFILLHHSHHIKRQVAEIPDQTIESVSQHDEWYRAYSLYVERRRELLAEYKELKETVGEKEKEREEKRRKAAAREKRKEEERLKAEQEEKKEAVRRWKEERERMEKREVRRRLCFGCYIFC